MLANNIVGLTRSLHWKTS